MTRLLLLALVLSGCFHSGAKTVVRDRFDYSTAIGDSLKDQTLLNIVKLRYLDVPVFVEVAQIINGYEFQGGASLGASLVRGDADQLDLGVEGSYSNRPTITYTPLTGNQYVRGLMIPLPPEIVFFTVQSGYSADVILRTCVSSINGLRNDGGDLGDADFFQVTRLFHLLQSAGALTLLLQVKPDREHIPVLTFGLENQPPEVLEAEREMKRLLRLSPGASEFRLVFGRQASEDTEIAVQSRSLIQILGALAIHVEVPPSHQALALAAPGTGDAPGGPGLFRVNSSPGRPENAYAAVRYRDHWYWIDDRDLDSKRVLALTVLLFSLGDSKAEENLPVLMVPVN